ncbi:MAG TPA: class I SAM-dependent methyltransferase [Chitinophagaceae bacterium]|nr:class I SAM-dependent methyltransferase [Chitinophagaceae bacterium]
MNSLTKNIDQVGAGTLSMIAAADAFNRWMYNAIKPWLFGQVLELGSGIGNISVFVLNDQFKTVLSDINPSYIHFLQQKFRANKNLIRIVSIDLQHPHFNEEYEALQSQFDSIFLLNVIEHLKDDDAAVRNCNYLLRQGGHLVLLAPAYPFLYCLLDKNLGHFRRYTKKSLAALLYRNNHALLTRKYFNMAGIAGWLVWGKLLRRSMLDAKSFGTFNKLVPFFKLMDKIVFHQVGLSAIAVGKKL